MASFGAILVPVALFLIWINERKIVKYEERMAYAKKTIVTNAKEPFDEHELQLVHTVGNCENKRPIIDDEFSVKVPNSYRLKRVVEML